MRIGEISRQLETVQGARTDQPLASDGKKLKSAVLKAAGISTVVRIGEISRELEKAQKVGQGSEVRLPTAGKLKSAVLKAAGISTSAAHRAEKLASNARPASTRATIRPLSSSA